MRNQEYELFSFILVVFTCCCRALNLFLYIGAACYYKNEYDTRNSNWNQDLEWNVTTSVPEIWVDGQAALECSDVLVRF